MDNAHKTYPLIVCNLTNSVTISDSSRHLAISLNKQWKDKVEFLAPYLIKKTSIKSTIGRLHMHQVYFNANLTEILIMTKKIYKSINK